MHRSSPLRRFTAVAVLALSTVVAALLPVAHAYAESSAVATTAHVEAAGSDSCAPAHDEVACQLCRVLRLSATWSEPAALPVDDTPGRAHASWSAPAPQTLLPGRVSARAPPLG
jgi:hypothetical protein